MRLGALLPRAVLVAMAWVLATAAFTLAADQKIVGPSSATPATVAQPPQLTVPAVTGQAFVFAKGLLEDAGFAWTVSGSVRGYAGNQVASQNPVPGTKVVDTGAPTVVLQLAKGSYAQTGVPEDSSSYRGTAIKLVVPPKTTLPHAAAPAPKKTVVPKPKAKPKPKPKPKATPKAKPAAKRTPAFHLAGARKEPLDEISLPARADRLAAWVATNPRRTSANLHRWLYQHAWIVDGANFGWWHGDRALVKLIAVDRRVERMWGVGRRSEVVARAALARVRRLSR
jgi:hypothetical protein